MRRIGDTVLVADAALIAYIPLTKAMLCLNDKCGVIFEVGPERCPACTDSSAMPLQKILERREETRCRQ